MERSEVSLRILLVEDCPDTAASTRILLEIWGHEVRVAGNGSAALSLAESFQPEIVLVDIGLPGGMDGFAVARRLREMPWDVAPVLVAATGYEGLTIRRCAREAGCSYFLPKPFDLPYLRKILTTLAVVPLAALV